MSRRAVTDSDGFFSPVVDLRCPRLGLIWPVLFTTLMTAFVSFVIVSSNSGDGGSLASRVGGAALMVSLLVALPIAAIVGYARSSVRSFGKVLRMRSGFKTRLIPAEDIDGFVVVNQVGIRRNGRGMKQPAISLRPGSRSYVAEYPDDPRAFVNWLRAAGRYLANRRGRDLPIICVPAAIFSTRHVDMALAQLTEWHRWALS